MSETFIARELGELKRQGVDARIVSLRGDTATGLANKFAVGIVAEVVRGYYNRPRRFLSLIRRAGQAGALAELARESGARLLLSQFAWTTADVCGMAARHAGIPFWVRAHARDVFAQSADSLMERLKGSRGVLPCNRAAAGAVLEAGFPGEKTRLVHHGLPLREPLFRWREPAPGSGQVVGIGRLVPKKGVEYLLRACAVLRERGVGLRLEWIGDGPERERLMRVRGEIGLEGMVDFKGALPHEGVMESLRKTDLLVLPSVRTADGDRDGIANVLLEAMAVGVPVITTAAGSAGELVENGGNGILVEAGNEVALAGGIERMLGSLPLRIRLAREARLTVERDFDLERNVALLKEVLFA